MPGSGPVQRERRAIDHQQPLVGGERGSDPPLTTRDCADWMGVSTECILDAVDDGFLKAEEVRLRPNGKRLVRIHLADFIDYLKTIGWKHLPRLPRE